MKERLIVIRDEEDKKLLDWYQWLHDAKQRGERARLRRCDSLDEVLMQRGFYSLCKRLPRLEPYALRGLALVAGLLAWNKTKVEISLPEILGSSKEGSDKPRFSELRFQRLLASDDAEEFFQSMRRAIVQAGEQSDPLTLADFILHWFQQHQHPDWYSGQKQWQYRFAKPYYAQVI